MTQPISKLDTLDVVMFILTLAISVLIGVYFTNKNATMKDYMLGGRNQRLLPVSLSLMTSFVSGLTLVGAPAEFYYHGLGYATNIFGILGAMPAIAFILLPVFYRLNNVSLYQYLELRYSSYIRKLVSLLFMIQMTIYNAVVLFIPSMSLRSVLGISNNISIGATGVACIIYASLGGIKAVIWTDFFQAGLMFLSQLFVAVLGTVEAGGLGNLVEANKLGNRLTFSEYFTLDWTSRNTIYTILLGDSLLYVFMNGANQIQVQRMLTLPTLRLAQWSVFLNSILTAFIIFVCHYIGMVMFSTYAGCDPFKSGAIDKKDALLIYYISQTNIAGIRGLFVAGIFAATLSTLSSFQNSMSALMLEDFIKPCLRKPMNEKTEAYLSRIIAFCFGVICVGLSLVVGRISMLLQVAVTLMGALGAPLLSAFMMGILTRSTNTSGMFIGMLVGFSFGLYVEFYQVLVMTPLPPTRYTRTDNCPLVGYANSSAYFVPPPDFHVEVSKPLNNLGEISYLWIGPMSLVITCSIAMIVSLLTGGLKQQVDDRFLVAWLHKDKPDIGTEMNNTSTAYDNKELVAECS